MLWKYEHLKKERMKIKNYSLWRNCCCWTVTNEFHAFAALVLNSVTDSIVRLRVLKFSAAAFIALTVVVDTNCSDYVLGDLV